MGLRFCGRFRILPGVRVNLSKSGASVSIGRRGATLNVGEKGARVTAGLPGTGLSYWTKLTTNRQPSADPPSEGSPAGRGWLIVVLFALVIIVLLAVTK